MVCRLILSRCLMMAGASSMWNSADVTLFRLSSRRRCIDFRQELTQRFHFNLSRPRRRLTKTSSVKELFRLVSIWWKRPMNLDQMAMASDSDRSERTLHRARPARHRQLLQTHSTAQLTEKSRTIAATINTRTIITTDGDETGLGEPVSASSSLSSGKEHDGFQKPVVSRKTRFPTEGVIHWFRRQFPWTAPNRARRRRRSIVDHDAR